ncbi:MAG: LysE family transporter [Bdellovibrionota bacterium]
MEKIFFEGFALQASLIFALGAQNLFVLEAGMRKRHHLTVSLVCFLCDLTLILLGVAGAATLFNLLPSLKFIIGFAGVGFLFTYGMKKFTEVSAVVQEGDSFAISLKRSALLAVTFSILNPHAYLDAFVLIGGYSSKYADLDQRIMLGLGAGIYSGLWFLVLSSFSGFMKPLFNNQKRMKMISVCTGIFLVYLSGKLAVDLVKWMPANVDFSHYVVAATPDPGLLLYSSILF